MASSPESVGFSSEGLERLDDAMRKAVADGEVSGVSTLLIRQGKEVAFRAHGVSNVETRAPLRRDAIFQMASMTKPVTGVAMMILFEEGKWHLDDPVTKFVPELEDLRVRTGVDGSGQPVLTPMKRSPTMRELMSHTAGFGYDLDVYAATGLQQMIERIADKPLLYQPGERWAYSIAVDIQSHIVEKLSGQPFGEFLQQRIFGPLKMIDTGFSVPADRIGRLATLYSIERTSGELFQSVSDADRIRRPSGDFTQRATSESGGGGLLSTIDDYARFAQMLANGGALDGVRILSPASVELMRTNVVSEAALATPSVFLDAADGFGLDLRVVVDPSKTGRLEGIGTMSWEGATGTFFWVDPTNDLVFVGMLQTLGQFGPRDRARTLVYQALAEPANPGK